MRPVPSRSSSRTSLGFTPTDGKLDERITSLKRFSPLASAYDGKPLDVGWEKKIQTYGDAVWGAIRVLQDAAKAQRRVYSFATNGYKDVPENAAPYEEAMKRVLDQFNPDAPGVQGSIQKGEEGPGWVTWKTLPILSSLLNAGGLFGTAKGTEKEFENAKKSKDALLKQVEQIRSSLRGNVTRSMKVDEPVVKATERWKAEDEAAAAAPTGGPTPDSTLPTGGPTPDSTLPTGGPTPDSTLTDLARSDTTGPSRAEPGLGLPAPSPEGTPSWLVPALVAATAAGVALLVLPSGSASRGAQDRPWLGDI